MNDGEALSGGFETAYDLYMQGHSYSEIAAMTGDNLFNVMREVAETSRQIMEIRKLNLDAEYEFVIHTMHETIKQAWKDHGNEIGDKGQTVNALPIVAMASRVLLTALAEAKKVPLADDAKDKVNANIDRELLRNLGKAQIQQQFREKQDLRRSA